ncbi:MAG: metallophosphoesterase family protein [Planctomycetota bacterium]|nr:metallophosphoesterase family protein [Planctomycetota bacterium]
MDEDFRSFERAARLRGGSAFSAQRKIEERQRRHGQGQRVAVISDIHANLEALTSVLEDLSAQSCDFVVCLGDIVGYGANPIQCVELVRKYVNISIIGNHDAAAIGHHSAKIHYWGAYAKDATLWTRKVLRDKDKQFLASLPFIAHYGEATFVHGTLYSPELFDYIQTSYDAYLTLQILENAVCFVGHSHVPIAFFNDNPVSFSLEPLTQLRDGMKTIINVGSVGQPRDDNPKAAYAIHDLVKNTIEIRRVQYDVELARDKIHKAGLSMALGDRLIHGR